MKAKIQFLSLSGSISSGHSHVGSVTILDAADKEQRGLLDSCVLEDLESSGRSGPSDRPASLEGHVTWNPRYMELWL